METHFPPKGQSLIGKHATSKDCPCKPRRVTTTKAASSGRHGRHQGYSVKVEWHHNFIPETEQKED